MSDFKNLYNTYQKDLDSWLQALNVNASDTNSSDIEDFLSMNYDDISSLDIETLNRYVFVIYRHLVFVQNKINECKAFINWCRQVQNRIKNNDELSTLHNWKNIAENRIIRMEYIVRRIEMICKPVENLIFIKKRKQ